MLIARIAGRQATTRVDRPRVEARVATFIVETPIGASYCSTRANITAQLSAHSITLPAGGEIKLALAVEVTGLAFQDFAHKRGTALVATDWELHPAIVNL